MAEQVEQAVALVQDVLGDELVGLYLFGSSVLGGLTPTSDLDLLAVSRRPTTPEERRSLGAEHTVGEIRGSRPPRGASAPR